MNITGLRHRVRGSSLISASGTAFSSSIGSSNPPLSFSGVARPEGGRVAESVVVVVVVVVTVSVDPFSERPERQRGQEGEGNQNDCHTHHQANELRLVCG